MTRRVLLQRGVLACWLSCTLACDDTGALDTAVAASKVAPQATSSAGAEEAPPGVVDDGPVPVELDGTSHPVAVTLVVPGAARIYSTALRTWVHEKPSRDSQRLGYLRAGGSAPLRGDAVVTSDCPKGWHPIHPRGYICLNNRATLDHDNPIVQAVESHPPNAQRKLPYIYGTVRKPGPIYARLPSQDQLHQAESNIDERMPRWLDAGGEIGASYAQDVWSTFGEPVMDPRKAWENQVTKDVPEFLSQGQQAPNIYRKPRAPDQLVLGTMAPRVGHSFLETFLWHGRRYGLSTQLQILPTDRLRPIQGSDFHGVVIGKDVEFPFAFVRSPIAKFHNGKSAPYRAVLELTGHQQFFDKVLHYETKDHQWISDRYASRVRPARKMPGWAVKGEKWIDVNVTKQVLVLYEGTEPVYATLISSGEAGLEDPDHTTATKRGIFRIHTKHVTTTMSSREIGEEFELRDVPYVQYFDTEGYALHGAYWHDRFGTPKSHGCINLSPEDARRIFYWTEPRVPTGWHGVLLPLKGTVLFIHP